MIAAQKLDAGHDTNGNPQRLWVIYRTGEDLHVSASPLQTIILEEGYAGRRILLVDMMLNEYRSFIELETVKIPVAEYKRLRKRRLE